MKKTLLTYDFFYKYKKYFVFCLFVLGCILISSDVFAASNAACKISTMQEKYQSSCYSCLIVRTLLEQFMAVGGRTYALCSEAGVKILLLATCLWLAFFVLKNLASLANVEPISIVNQLLKQLFKVLFAYVVIVSGTNTFVNYVVNPVLATGADYGLAIIEGANNTLGMQASGKYNYEGESLFSNDVMNKIIGVTEGIDRVVSTNLVIGHALTCHSVNAGAWRFDLLVVTITIPDIWIWLCGAIIWFFGFMLTLGVSYYLLDLSFKIGISIILFPITMGLWPFSSTSDKVISCIRTILKSAAIFAFLVITTTYGMSLISVALRDITEFYSRIENGDSKWVSETFDITGSFFLILMFAYVYAFLLVSKTITSYVNKFFSGGILSGANPMHSGATMMTDAAKRPVMATGRYAKDVAREQGGKAIKQVGKGVSAAGKGMTKGGKGLMQAGKAMSSSGLGAIAGVPLMAVGAVVAGGGYVAQAAGKTVQGTGSLIKKSKDKPKPTGKSGGNSSGKLDNSASGRNGSGNSGGGNGGGGNNSAS